MRATIAVMSLALVACGLGLSGLGAPEGDAGTADGTVAPPPPPGDAAVLPDGAPADVVAPPPDPTKVTVSYAIGKNNVVYSFDAASSIFKALPSAGCPAGEETAVLSDGSVYLTSSDNRDFFRLTPTGCTSIKTGSDFPYALGTAPVGTLSATEETLIGYSDADYVKVDRTSGVVTVIGQGALGNLRPSGDVTAIGTKGYLAALTNTGSCPSGGDCIVEVSLVTGAPVGAVKHLSGYSITGIAHSKGKLLLYANGSVYPYDVSTQMVGASMASWPGGANFSGAGAPPYPGGSGP